MNSPPLIYTFSDIKAASLKAAGIVLEKSLVSVRDKGFFTLVLAGGNTPKLLYQLLASAPFVDKIPWPQTHVFWGDERMAPRDHPDNNATMAFLNLLQAVPVPTSNIFPIPTGEKKAGQAARLYEKTIIDFFELQSIPTNAIHFDLMLLGMGADGHTASLFPGSATLKEKRHLTAAVDGSVMASGLDRVTMTLPLINRSSTILFLVDGARKAHLADSVLGSTQTTKQLPVSLVHAAEEMIWCVSRPTENS